MKTLYLQEKWQGSLLEDHLNQQLQAIASNEPWGQEAKDSGLLLDVLHTHTTPQGTTKPLTTVQYHALYPHIPYRAALLKTLTNRYLIIEPQRAELTSQQTRLAHDTLAQLVNTQYQHSELPGQKARRILQNRTPDFATAQQANLPTRHCWMPST